MKWLLAVAYIGTIVLANWLTSEFGFWPVGFGLEATAGTYAAGATLLIRDVVQDQLGRGWVLPLIGAGIVVSYMVGDGRIAVASAVAFAVSEVADWAVYTPLRDRGWVRAVVASNVVGAVLDTFLFLWVAGFPVTGRVVAGQLVGKGWATAVAVGGVTVRRVVLREPGRTRA